MSNKGEDGVIIDWERINDYYQQMSSCKLYLFLGLGCEAMKDVIFQATTNKTSVGDINYNQLQKMFVYLDWEKESIYIEAIPEMIALDETKQEQKDMINRCVTLRHWEEITVCLMKMV